MPFLRWAGRCAVAATLLAAASGLPTTQAYADHATSSVTWSAATTDTGSFSDFSEGSVSLPTAVQGANHLRIVTTGSGHDHGSGGTTLSVRLLPSGTTVWSRTLAADESVSLTIDVKFPQVASASGVQITSAPFQNQTYHGFSGADLVTVSHVVAACRDGVDNDADGRTDYPADPGCTHPDDDSEGVSCTTTSGAETCVGISSGTEIQRVRVNGVEVISGPSHTVVGHLDVYRFTLPNNTTVNLPCVVLVRDGTTTNPCGTAGGTFVSRTATLVDDEVVEPRVQQGSELASVGLCNAELVATVNGIGIASTPVFTLC